MPSIVWKRKDRSSWGAPKEALSIRAGAKGDGLNRLGEDFGSGPELSLPGPSIKSNDNLGTKSNDEDDEIGALIYDQVMCNKTCPNEMVDYTKYKVQKDLIVTTN